MADKPPFHWDRPLPAPDFVMVPKLVHREILKHLGGSEFKVFYALMVKAYEWGNEDAELSVAEIAEVTGVSRRMTIYAIQQLSQLGLIQVIRHRSREHGNEANTYRVMVTDDPRYVDRDPRAKIAPAPSNFAPARATAAPATRARSPRSKNIPKEDPIAIDHNKYTTGRYAVCSACSSRPCVCPE